MADVQVIDGKGFAERLRARVAAATAALKVEHGIIPGLAAVLVGEDPASQVYVRNKNRQTGEAGMASFHEPLPVDTPEADLLALVHRLNADPAVHGILVQLPLPRQIDPDKVIDAIDPTKDVDGFHVVNAGQGEQLRGLLALLVIGVCLKLTFDLVVTPNDAYSLGADGGH